MELQELEFFQPTADQKVMNRFLISSILSLLFISTLANADSCLPDHSLCLGDLVYGYKKDASLSLGKITSLPTSPGGPIGIDSNQFKNKDVARMGRTACTVDSARAKLCSGDPVRSSSQERGIVLGVFPSGYVAVTIAGKEVHTAKAKSFTVYSPDCEEALELKLAVQNVAFLPRVLDLPQVASCLANAQTAAPPVQSEPNPALKNSSNCNQPDQPITADDSPSKQYFQELLKKGMSAPIEDFLHLWYANHDNPTKETYFFSCEPASWTPLNLGKPGCQPDVLYSWGPQTKLMTIETSLKNDGKWTGNPNSRSNGVWATISPVSTYSYGLVPIRFKIKPGTSYLASYGTTSGVSYVSGILEDFIIGDASVIESYSYGTPEHYDEIIKDIRQLSSGKRAIMYVNNRGEMGNGMARVYAAGVPERGPQDETQLKTVLLEMIRMILNGEGRIVYAKGACHNRAQHFASDKPTYFNQ